MGRLVQHLHHLRHRGKALPAYFAFPQLGPAVSVVRGLHRPSCPKMFPRHLTLDTKPSSYSRD